MSVEIAPLAALERVHLPLHPDLTQEWRSGLQFGTPSFDQYRSLIRWHNRGRVTAPSSARYWPLVGAAFDAGVVDVTVEEAVVLNGYPGGPFT